MSLASSRHSLSQWSDEDWVKLFIEPPDLFELQNWATTLFPFFPQSSWKVYLGLLRAAAALTAGQDCCHSQFWPSAVIYLGPHHLLCAVWERILMSSANTWILSMSCYISAPATSPRLGGQLRGRVTQPPLLTSWHPESTAAPSVSRGVLQQAARASKSVTQMTHHIWKKPPIYQQAFKPSSS
jgi:hypothetical protein